jgi:hypothetical protein
LVDVGGAVGQGADVLRCFDGRRHGASNRAQRLTR